MELDYFFGLVKVDTKLARINEPPPGKDVNVYTKINGAQVRHIFIWISSGLMITTAITIAVCMTIYDCSYFD